jgi:hypothetical protein
VNRIDRTVGPVFLSVALALFVAFHFFPSFSADRGGAIWVGIWDLAVNQRASDLLEEGLGLIVATSMTFFAGIVASPFVIPMIRRSLIVRWFIAFVSALACLGLSLSVLASSREPGLGGICLLLSAACNFVGILLIPYEGRHRETLRKLSGN